MIDSDISREELTLVINEEQNYFKLTENIRKKANQLGDIEEKRSIGHGKRMRKTKSKTQNRSRKSIEIIRRCYHIACRRNTESKYPRVSKVTNGKKIILSRFSLCNSIKASFIKEQEANALLSQLGIRIRTSLSKIQLVRDTLF